MFGYSNKLAVCHIIIGQRRLCLNFSADTIVGKARLKLGRGGREEKGMKKEEEKSMIGPFD